MDGGELAALYTLQHGLSGNTEQLGGFKHGDVSFGRLFNKARTKLLGHADAPWGPGGDLFAGNEAVCKPSMESGGSKPKHFRGFLDRDQFPFRGSEDRVESWDFPIPAKITDFVSRKPVSVSRATAWIVSRGAKPEVSTARW